MRRIIILLLTVILFGSFGLKAQEEASDSTEEIQSVIDACIALRNAAATGDKVALKQAAIALKECEAKIFTELEFNEDSVESLDGHLVFDEAFADSLAQGEDAYRSANDIYRSAALRGQTNNGKNTRTFCIKAGKSAKYTFSSKYRQELAVVAEAGGLVSMRVHFTGSNGLNEWRTDTVDFQRGRPYRKMAYDPPTNNRYNVELEVFNRSGRDITFVVISN